MHEITEESVRIHGQTLPAGSVLVDERDVQHPVLGIVFRKEGRHYIRVDNDPELPGRVAEAIMEQQFHDLDGLLVRRSTDSAFGYYPLALIWAEREDRYKAALHHAKRPPSEGWVAAKRREVLTWLTSS